MESSNLLYFTKPSDLNSVTIKNFERLFVLLFFTEWNDCSLKIKDSIIEMANYLKEPIYILVNADKYTELTDSYKIESVPTLAFIDGTK